MTSILLWQFVWLPLLLLLVFPVAIQYERETWPHWMPFVGGGPFPRILRVVCKVIAGFALLFDVYLNFTTLALYIWDRPARGEWTFSTRLKRLQFYPGWRGAVARVIRDYLNFFQARHV